MGFLKSTGFIKGLCRVAAVAAIGVPALSFVSAPAFAQGMKVPLTKCATPVGSVAVDAGEALRWVSMKQEDPTPMLMAIALDTNCFTRAGSAASSDFVLTASPIDKATFDRGSNSLPDGEDAAPAPTSARMVHARLAIRTRSGAPVLQGVGRNNVHKLDWSQTLTNPAAVSQFLGPKQSRMYSGALLNAFGDTGVTKLSRASMQASVAAQGPQQMAQTGGQGPMVGASRPSGSSAPSRPAPQSSPYSQPGAPAVSTVAGLPSLGSASGETLDEILEGRAGQRPEFAARWKTPQRAVLKTYFGTYVEQQIGGNAVLFQRRANSTGTQDDLFCYVDSAHPLFPLAISLERGTPIIVEGTFEVASRAYWNEYKAFGIFDAVWKSNTGWPDFLISKDCRITGTWDPYARALITTATGPAEQVNSLIEEAKANKFGFTRAYENKRLAVTGKLHRISETETGEVLLSFNHPKIDGFSGAATCAIPSSQADQAAQLRSGQTITVSATIQKDTGPLPLPFAMENCQLE